MVEVPDDATEISIHAPARGATVGVYCNVDWYNISIHAPARGATDWDLLGRTVGADFNPRSREGSDNSRTAASPRP